MRITFLEELLHFQMFLHCLCEDLKTVKSIEIFELTQLNELWSPTRVMAEPPVGLAPTSSSSL